MLRGEQNLSTSISFPAGYGSIVGAFYDINYNDIINSISIKLKSPSDWKSKYQGRTVTCMYWIVNENFSINNLDIINAMYATDIELNNSISGGIYRNFNNNTYYPAFFSTKNIPKNTEINVTFKNFTNYSNNTNMSYGNTLKINSNRIFIALVSNDGKGTILSHTISDTHDMYYSILEIPLGSGSSYYYKNGSTMLDTSLTRVNNGSLIIKSERTAVDSEDSIVPDAVICKNISYRTWSDPKTNITINNSEFNNKYLTSYLDGGENHNDVNITELIHTSQGDVYTHIIHNRTSSSTPFISDYYLPEGRLSDVTFTNPGNPNNIRWVFKRSRIKLTIPAYSTKSNNMQLSMQIKTPIYSFEKRLNDNTDIYYGKEIIKTYKENEEINIVVCPRDEGILDNMPFEIVLKRKFNNRDKFSPESETVYKFHTYQKPTVDIVYPKLTRNDSLGNGFRYAKINANTNYSNFNGENSIVSKHVCDSLVVMFAVPKNDDSGIPIFIRYYLAEYKYGRTGLLKSDDKFNTLQDLYRSKNTNDYVTLNEILTNNTNKRTAELTNICINDGKPLLFSGKMQYAKLKNIGKDYNLWTYKTWDDVVGKNNDVEVGNAWIIEDSNNNQINPLTIPDHYGVPIDKNLIDSNSTKDYYSDEINYINKDNANQNNNSAYERQYSVLYEKNEPNNYAAYYQVTDKRLLFRAGYIYLLRARSFHGACCGAIHAKYSGINSNIFGDRNSGAYDYSNANYAATININNVSTYIEYPDEDIANYGENDPYNGWVGCEDGTSGQPLLAKYNYNDSNFVINKINQTYPGFSIVDYTIFEVVSPYVSKSNMITIHPTSSEIGANQWITFNYRHLSKNIGGIDSYAIKPNGEYVNGSFGKRSSGIQNTMTRIMSMHTTCIEKIIKEYIKYRDNTWKKENNPSNNLTYDSTYDPQIENELFEIYQENVNSNDPNNNDTYNSHINDSNYTYKNTINYKHNINNKPMISGFDNYGETYIDRYGNNWFNNAYKVKDRHMYSSQSALYYFNNYRNDLLDNKTFTEFGTDSLNWTDDDLVWKEPKNENMQTEPLGNTYRWQVVINAMSTSNNSMEEIKIESQNEAEANTPTNYNHGEYVLKTTAFNDNNINKLYAYNEENNNSISEDFDLQTKYFYKESDFKIDNTMTQNTDDHRFTINEFVGYTYIVNNFPEKADFPEKAGFPVSYTTESSYNDDQGTVHYFKFFTTNETQKESYGKLFTRIPSVQDCENGYILTSDNLNNIGSVSLNPPSSSNINNQQQINNNDMKSHTPLVRTTHYLFFKTYILTSYSFRINLKYKKYEITGYTEDENPEPIYELTDDDIIEALYFDGKKLEKNNKTYIRFGNNGISEVYGEDNNGWGRCLSADDDTSIKITINGEYKQSNKFGIDALQDVKTKSGGIEVPIAVRRTPMLQPTLVCEYIDKDYLNLYNPCSKMISVNYITNKNYFIYDYMNENHEIESKKTESYTLQVCYPFIPENKSYYTRLPNGGRNNTYYGGFYLDLDTDPSKQNVDSSSNALQNKNNEDFFGGYGICTSYTVILVPNNINISKAIEDNIFTQNEINQYFKDVKKKNNKLYGRLEYFKQKANFYSKSDIYKLESIDGSTIKPVLIAYDYIAQKPISINPNIPEEYLADGTKFTFTDCKGRNFQKILINPDNLCNGKVLRAELNSDSTINTYTTTLDTLFNTPSDTPSKFNDNILKGGVIYDLLIIPNYSNSLIHHYDFISGDDRTTGEGNKKGSGKINNINFGSNSNDGEILFAGSNPLVYNNYFAVTSIKNNGGGGGGGGTTPPKKPDENKILDSDACIVFPNVDKELYNLNNNDDPENNNPNDNVTNHKLKESPGFWLNNTFRLILRMPSFRTNNTRINYNDLDTIEYQSNNSSKVSTANDFLFDDIQIHVGKLEDDALDLNHIDETDKLICGNGSNYKQERLNHHIYSYKDFPYIFSKKLYNEDNTDNVNKDTRKLLTAGAISDNQNNYENRFIEVNLSLLEDFKTEYNEGYYIQFRWKSQYSTGNEGSTWSNWYGGSKDGGLSWWGDSNSDNKGCDYFVPIRNYTEIFTDFRNYIKESYPGSMINYNVNNNKGEIGKGSKISHALLNNNSKTKPKSAIVGTYYICGNGNKNKTNIVPTQSNIITNIKSITTDYIKSQYIKTHHENYSIDNNIVSNNQQIWEMLYLDYIISNMCKLYSKPKHNNISLNGEQFFGSIANRSLRYGCGLPKNVEPLDWKYAGWSDTEYVLNEDKKEHKNDTTKWLDFQYNIKENNVIKENINSTVNKYDSLSSNGYIRGFNINKYYRKPITKNDFDELNKHLINLLNYIGKEEFSGKTNENANISIHFGIKDILPLISDNLNFEKHRKEMIGSTMIRESNQSNTNNLYNLMCGTNYLQFIYNNIITTCSISESKGNVDKKN